MKFKLFFLLSFACSFLSVTEAVSAPKQKLLKSETAQKVTPEVTPLTLLSIIPAQAEPGTKIMLSGAGFGEIATVFIGSIGIPARVTDGKQAEFSIPTNLEAGIYALYLKRADGVTGRTYSFNVLPLRPELNSLNPARISHCATGKEREVTAKGENLIDASMLYFDGAAIPKSGNSQQSISFLVPAVPGGLHQVQIKNAPDNVSATLTLAVDTVPEIAQVTIGNEHVNYYDLLISGNNFNQNSSIYVDGTQIGGRGGQDMAEREKLIYIDCTKLIYQRHPYSPVNKDFRLQIVNPGGEGSRVITVTAP